jgi:secreted Zn-dependent insulinase-like peptidase
MANRLLKLFEEDQKAIEKVSKLNSKEEVLKFFQNKIPNYSEQDLLADVEEIKALQKSSTELDMEQLEKVAGGGAGETVTAIFTAISQAASNISGLFI